MQEMYRQILLLYYDKARMDHIEYVIDDQRSRGHNYRRYVDDVLDGIDRDEKYCNQKYELRYR